MSKVLVTGAYGFLAGNLIMELLRRGYAVRGMVRKESGLMLRDDNRETFFGNITALTNNVDGIPINFTDEPVIPEEAGIYHRGPDIFVSQYIIIFLIFMLPFIFFINLSHLFII